MNIDDYQKEALRTAPRDIDAYDLPQSITSAVWAYVTDDREERQSEFEKLLQPLLEKQDQMVWTLGLTGEAGEFADMMKKHHGHGHDLDREKAAKELGDVLWYVSVLANSLGYTMSQVAQMNIYKLRARYRKGFTIEESKEGKKG